MKSFGSFISNRTTTFCLPGYHTNTLPTHTGISQGSPLLPIRFLFYNVHHIDACNFSSVPTSGISFVDYVNALAFGKLTEDNCRMLQSVHKHCLGWARRHGASFAQDKYILVHFTKVRTKPNTPCPLTLPSFTICPSSSAHVFGVILDKKLSWHLHLQHIQSKLATQTFVLKRLIASTWGASSRVSRLCFTAIVIPAITTIGHA